MKYLITGGAGFVGCHLANALLNEGNEVIIFDNLSRKGTENNLKWLEGTHKDLKYIKGDIRDYESVARAAKEAEVIYHAAAQVAVTTSVSEPRDDFEINALGTFNVLEAARNAKTNPIFIFTSTNKVYGGMEDVAVEEKDTRYDYRDLKTGVSEGAPLDFHSPYGCSKGAADQYVRDYARIYGIKSVVLRMSCQYGTRQFGNEDQGWVAHFTISSIFNSPLTIFGDGKQVRDVLYIDDLVDVLLSVKEKIDRTKGEVYNIGGGPENTISLLELLDYLEELSGRGIEYSFDDWRPGDQKVFYCDISKAGKELGWKPKISPKEGVKRLYNWVIENEELFKVME